MTGTRKIFAHIAALLLCMWAVGSLSSCIQPPLRLPAQDLVVEMPAVLADIEVVWDIEVDWEHEWHYGWDEEDLKMFGPVEYPIPPSYEVRRYYLGKNPHVPHTTKEPYTIFETRFRDLFQFGYYDMLFWSNIDAQEQVLVVDESDLDTVTATTTVTKSISLKSGEDTKANALYNQPEIFYSAYPRDIYISHYKEDYDYFDEEQQVWVKRIEAELDPLVFIYLVQIIIINNDGRVTGISGDCALSAFAAGTNVNTGHTFNDPCMVYFPSRMKHDMVYNGQKADIIGAKFTTFGLCDMDGYRMGTKGDYEGSRPELPNYLYYELRMASGSVVSLHANVTEQCQKHCHGGVITVVVDAKDIDDPGGEGGSIFNPVVDDYENLEWEIPL